MLAIPFTSAAETALDISPLVGHTPLLLPSDRESSSPILPVWPWCGLVSKLLLQNA